MKKNILLVDDEPRVLQALQHMLAGKQNEWRLEFADSASKALSLMAKMEFRIVVSDLTMPGMDGRQLLEEVRQRYPQTKRIVLCWRPERQSLTRVFGIAQEYLYKPCEPEVLIGTLTRALAQSELLADSRLRMVVGQLKLIPSMPSLYLELIEEMRSGDMSMSKVDEIFSRDPGMAAKISQLVNRAFLGGARQVSSPAEAVAFLGLETVKALVLSLQVFAQFERRKIQAIHLGTLWKHSWETAQLARDIAVGEDCHIKQPDQSFAAGLMHDIGKLLLAANLPDVYQEALDMTQTLAIPVCDAERHVIGASHDELGGYLLGLWGLPQPVVEAVAFHHHPNRCPQKGFQPLTAVHVANALDHSKANPGLSVINDTIDHEYLDQVGFAPRWDEWKPLATPPEESVEREPEMAAF